MSKVEDIRMTLSMYLSMDSVAVVEMKAKRFPVFITKVERFLFDEDDTKVVFQRCDETTYFPENSEKLTTYITTQKS